MTTGGGSSGWGSSSLRRSMSHGGDGLGAYVAIALVFGVPGVIARSWILLIIAGIAAVVAGSCIAARVRNR